MGTVVEAVSVDAGVELVEPLHPTKMSMTRISKSNVTSLPNALYALLGLFIFSTLFHSINNVKTYR